MKKIKNRAEFEEIIAGNKTVLVDFYAEWCGPCQVLLPTLEELSEEYDSQVTFLKINVDDHADLAAEFKVRSIPKVFIIQDTEVKDEFVGVQNKKQIVDKITPLIS